MIKLQDFARQQGVTDRTIQKHLNKYADELKGHFERKGPNGTWLDDEACEIIRSKMKAQPIVIGEAEQLAEIEELKKQVANLQDKLIRQSEKLLAQAEELRANDKLLLEAEINKDKVLTLEADKKALTEALTASEEALKAERSKGFFEKLFSRKKKG